MKNTIILFNENLQSFFKTIPRLQSILTIEIFIGFLHLAEIQSIIKKELKGKSGIYGFLCKTNNKLYIGSSIELSIRFNKHINGLQSNILLQNAINKYNLQDFIFIVFEYCEPEELLSREQFYMNTLEPEFNILKVAGSSLGFIHKKESKTKMSFAQKSIDRSGDNNPRGMLDNPHSEKTKALISLRMSGRVVSKETKALISLTNSDNNHPMFGKTHTIEAKEKISATQGTAIYVYDLQGSLVNTFISARKAAEYFDTSHITIMRYTKNDRQFKNNWILSTFLISNK